MTIEREYTILDEMEDNDGNYSFQPPTKFTNAASAISRAWEVFRQFLESENGEDYRGERFCDELAFKRELDKHHMIVCVNQEGSCRKVFRLLTVPIHLEIF